MLFYEFLLAEHIQPLAQKTKHVFCRGTSYKGKFYDTCGIKLCGNFQHHKIHNYLKKTQIKGVQTLLNFQMINLYSKETKLTAKCKVRDHDVFHNPQQNITQYSV